MIPFHLHIFTSLRYDPFKLALKHLCRTLHNFQGNCRYQNQMYFLNMIPFCVHELNLSNRASPAVPLHPLTQSLYLSFSAQILNSPYEANAVLPSKSSISFLSCNGFSFVSLCNSSFPA